MSQHEIVIPGYLLGTDQEAVAFMNVRDELVLPVSKGRSASIVINTRLISSWNCKAYSSTGNVTSCATIPVDSGSRITVLTGSAHPVEISRVVLTDS